MENMNNYKILPTWINTLGKKIILAWAHFVSTELDFINKASAIQWNFSTGHVKN